MNAADVLDMVDAVDYVTFPAACGAAPTTVCRLVTRYGWAVLGASTPARASDFDEGKARRNAHDHAVRQLVELERYAARRTAGVAT